MLRFKIVNFYFIFFFIIFLSSCKWSNKSALTKDTINHSESKLSNISPIIDFNVKTTPNAPTRITRKIKQDKEGNLLIASYEGIIRYDGHSFVNITKEAGLDKCYAFDVLEDKKGNIWIASDQEGVYRSNGKSITNFSTKDGLGHRRNICIYEDKTGNIWIGGQGGATCYDGKTFRNFSTKVGMSHNDINTIMEDRTGKIWFGTRGNACVYDPSAILNSDRKKFNEITNDEGLPFFNVWSIIEDQRGYIWLSDSVGLWRYDGHSFTHVSSDSGGGLYEDKMGNIWTTGLPRFSPSFLSRFDKKSLLDEQIKAIPIFKTKGALLGISEDNEGNIWVGGDAGVWSYDGKSVNYFTGN